MARKKGKTTQSGSPRLSLWIPLAGCIVGIIHANMLVGLNHGEGSDNVIKSFTDQNIDSESVIQIRELKDRPAADEPGAGQKPVAETNAHPADFKSPVNGNIPEEGIRAVGRMEREQPNLQQLRIGERTSRLRNRFSREQINRQSEMSRAEVNRRSEVSRTEVNRRSVSRAEVNQRSETSRAEVNRRSVSRSQVNRGAARRSEVNRRALSRADVNRRSVSRADFNRQSEFSRHSEVNSVLEERRRTDMRSGQGERRFMSRGWDTKKIERERAPVRLERRSVERDRVSRNDLRSRIAKRENENRSDRLGTRERRSESRARQIREEARSGVVPHQEYRQGVEPGTQRQRIREIRRGSEGSIMDQEDFRMTSRRFARSSQDVSREMQSGEDIQRPRWKRSLSRLDEAGRNRYVRVPDGRRIQRETRGREIGFQEKAAFAGYEYKPHQQSDYSKTASAIVGGLACLVMFTGYQQKAKMD